MLKKGIGRFREQYQQDENMHENETTPNDVNNLNFNLPKNKQYPIMQAITTIMSL